MLGKYIGYATTVFNQILSNLSSNNIPITNAMQPKITLAPSNKTKMELFLSSIPTTIHNSNPHPLIALKNSLYRCVSGSSLLNLAIGVQWIRSGRAIYAFLARIYSHHRDVFCLMPPIVLTLMTNLKKSTANWRNNFAIDHKSGAHKLEFSTALKPELGGKERKITGHMLHLSPSQHDMLSVVTMTTDWGQHRLIFVH